MRKLTEMNDAMKAKYAELFTAALDSMEKAEWQKPWVSPNNGVPCNFYRKQQPYRGVNHFLLKLLCTLEGFETPYFLTFDQITNKGGDLKYDGLRLNETLALDENGMPAFTSKGMPKMIRPTSFPVWKFLPRFRNKDGERISLYEYESLTDEEKEECRRFFSLFTYHVFNLDQTNFKELFPEDYAAMTEVQGHEYDHNVCDLVLEHIIMDGDWRCPILLGGHSAHFSPSQDHIRLPQRSRFNSDETFYGTALHEMAHSTAPELHRELGGTFGSKEYGMEEFVAELTSACVGSMLGIGKLLDEQHLAYVDNWRAAIRENGDFIPQVIDHVQRATNYILRHYEAVSKKLNLPKLIAA